jgi:DNA invertase Pin-like site-specific DNA recombinase
VAKSHGTRQARRIDAVLVTELSRWGRSTTDLPATLTELEARWVSVVALNGMTFDLATPHGRMMAAMLAGITEFERELIRERIRSGIAAAKARGKFSAANWAIGRNPTGSHRRYWHSLLRDAATALLDVRLDLARTQWPVSLGIAALTNATHSSNPAG